MEKSKPYINLFVGDWLRDTRILTAEERGAWIDILCYMSHQQERGVITADITDVSRLIGEFPDKTAHIIKALGDKRVAEVDILPDGKIKITSRRMVRDTRISASKSKGGKAGMKSRYQKPKKTVITTDKTNDITDVITDDITNSGIGIDNGNNIDKEIGGAGERENLLQQYLSGIVGDLEMVPTDVIPDLVLQHQQFAKQLDTLCIVRQFKIKDPAKDAEETARLAAWMQIFNNTRKIAGEVARPVNQWISHFSNWLGIGNKNLMEPHKFLDNAASNAKNNGTNNNSGNRRHGAPVDELQSLRRGGPNDDTQRTEYTTATIVK